MSKKIKSLLWEAPIPLLAIAALIDWSEGKLPGFWAWVVCFLAFAYVVGCVERLSLRQGK